MQTSQQAILDRIITQAAELQASDLHLTIGNPPILRVEGKLVPLEHEQILTPDFIEIVVNDLLSERQRQILTQEKELVLTHTFSNKVRFRISIFFQKGYLSVSLRLIPTQIRMLDELGLPASVKKFVSLTRGLLLVTGPFGSGRSTTAAAIINDINQSRAEHIVTIERPIEFLFVNATSIVEQREIGRDTKSYEQALNLILKEDVNVVLVSEMEEPPVIKAALEVADSGRLVIGVMNTDSTVKTVERIIDAFPQDEQEAIRSTLADNLQGIMTQRLLPKIGGGQVIVVEILMPNEPTRSVIKDGAIYQINNILQTSREEGMISLDRSLAELVRRGEILIDDALACAIDRSGLKMMLGERTESAGPMY